ncbi:MAG: Tex family protein [Pseudomonadota bacterium]
MTTNRICQAIADELRVSLGQVTATVGLLDEGATVPFIARYRKEVTGSLDDGQLRTLQERLRYLRELEERRQTIIKVIEEQGKLTPELAQSIGDAATKTQLEDIYLPYKPKRRTKGQIAIEAGLEPLAECLYSKPELIPEQEAQGFLNSEHNIHTTKDALNGAKYILMERFSEDAQLLGKLRQFLKHNGSLCAKLIEGKETAGVKFKDYFDHQEALNRIPSHRALALFRGRNEGILSLSTGLVDDIKADNSAVNSRASHPCEAMVASHWSINQDKEQAPRPADQWLNEVVRWTWRVKLLPHLENDLFSDIREQAESDAIEVFANNLKDLLLAAPAGAKTTMGLDPGLRTGVKIAVVDATGKILDHGAIFPHAPQHRVQEAEATLLELCQRHSVEFIAIGNGTASRETDNFVKTMLKRNRTLKAKNIMVSEAGASVYSASEFAAREFPDLDVTIRGAISIARRLQDPLAELVKIEPKSIGVGQYQHDLSQAKLARCLDATVEDCVNNVGVELNTASVPLLAKVSGLNQSIANNIVSYRERQGAFKHREQLKDVPRLGEKAYELAAGFLRIANGDNPLDASAVHPEAYPVVQLIAEKSGQALSSLLNNAAGLKQMKPESFTTGQFGLPTIVDIFKELEKPGRDPRPAFKMASFKEGVDTLSDLRPGMILEGVITNVTNFGAFVDIGVHQDGLVHISALSNTFVKDPRAVVKAGDVVKVKVMELDIHRKRIALTMRLDDELAQVQSDARPQKRHKNHRQKGSQATNTTGSLGKLLKEAIIKQK